jgi:Carbohydrate family 9 binding domain-like
VLRVPHAPSPIALDGDNDDPGWTRPPGPARTGPFARAGGGPARPYSDARLLWGDGYLYALLYAADDDIRAKGDAFRMRFSRDGVEYAIDVSADGSIRDAARDARGIEPDWRSGAHVSREIDGTLDDARDSDEEWSVEMAVPLASLGMKGQPGESAGFAVERCDAPGQRAQACGQWGETGGGGRLVIE